MILLEKFMGVDGDDYNGIIFGQNVWYASSFIVKHVSISTLILHSKTTSHILLFNYVFLNPQLFDQNNCRVEHIFGINDFILSELYAHDLYSQINDSNTVNQTSGYKMKMNNFLLPNERVLT